LRTKLQYQAVTVDTLIVIGKKYLVVKLINHFSEGFITVQALFILDEQLLQKPRKSGGLAKTQL